MEVRIVNDTDGGQTTVIFAASLHTLLLTGRAPCTQGGQDAMRSSLVYLAWYFALLQGVREGKLPHLGW